MPVPTFKPMLVPVACTLNDVLCIPQSLTLLFVSSCCCRVFKTMLSDAYEETRRVIAAGKHTTTHQVVNIKGSSQVNLTGLTLLMKSEAS